MLFKQVLGPPPGGNPAAIPNKEAETVYTFQYNSFAGDIPAGGSVCLDVAATVWYGFAVTRPATANLPLFIGVAPYLIPQGAWGLVCVYGIVETGLIDGGTVDVIVGSVLSPINATFYPTGSAGVGAYGSGHMFALTAQAGANATGRIFVRAL